DPHGVEPQRRLAGDEARRCRRRHPHPPLPRRPPLPARSGQRTPRPLVLPHPRLDPPRPPPRHRRPHRRQPPHRRRPPTPTHPGRPLTQVAVAAFFEVISPDIGASWETPV